MFIIFISSLDLFSDKIEMKRSTRRKIDPNCQDNQSSRSQEEVFWDRFALLYFQVDKTSLVEKLMADIWPKKLSLDDKMAPVPEDEVNVRLRSLYYKALVCCVGTRDNCEAEQQEIDKWMFQKKMIKNNLSFFQKSTSEIAD